MSHIESVEDNGAYYPGDPIFSTLSDFEDSDNDEGEVVEEGDADQHEISDNDSTLEKSIEQDESLEEEQELHFELATEEDWEHENEGLGTFSLTKQEKGKRKRNKGTKKRPSIISNVAAADELESLLTKGIVSPNYILEAEKYCTDVQLLEKLLLRPEIQESCLVLGIEKSQLLPQPIENFEKELDRPWKVHPQVASMRFQAFEKQRRHCVGSILQAQPLALQKRCRDAEAKNRNQDILSSSIHRSITSQMKHEKEFRAARVNFKKLRELQERDLRLRREKLTKQLQKKEEREHRIDQMKNIKKEHLKKRWIMKQDLIAKAEKERERQLEIKASKVKTRALAKERHLKGDNCTANKLRAENRNRQLKEEQHRQHVMGHFQDRQAQSYSNKESILLEKEILARKQKEQLDFQLMIGKEQKALEQKEREGRVHRMKSALQYKKKEKTGVMKQVYDRLDHMQELNAYLKLRNQRVWKQEHKQIDDWKEHHPSVLHVTPGPGEYDETIVQVRGGQFGKHNPKSEIEWQIYRANQLPAPGEYEVNDSIISGTKGGSFPKHVVPSEVEVLMKRAAEIPGPGRYQVKALPPTKSITFSKVSEPTEIAQIVQSKSFVPAPGEYDSQLDCISLTQRLVPLSLSAKFDPQMNTLRRNMTS